MTTTDYSLNNNNDITEIEKSFSDNTNQILNGNRLFNQWTGKQTDSNEYKQLLNSSTKPLKYYINNLNNISSLEIDKDRDQNTNFLTFTPIGNAAQVNVPNLLDRSVPSHLNHTRSIYTLPYSTSPNLSMTNNINTYDTDNDLILKTGVNLRNKNNRAEITAKEYNHYGDLHKDDIGMSVQNAGQYSRKSKATLNINIPGLKYSPDYSDDSYGIGINALGGVNSFGIPSRSLSIDIANGTPN